MKRKIALLVALMCGFLLFAGCAKPAGDKIESSTPTPTAEPTKDPETLEIESFLEKYVTTDARPIAVMVDNDDDNARPHAGLNEAYLIYEMLIEGGSTRFLAVFQGVDT